MSRIRWYHYFVVLAGFNVAIIAAVLWLHHQTLSQFRSLLRQVAILDARQRDLTSLARSVRELAGPLVRALEAGAVAESRRALDRARADLAALKDRRAMRGDDAVTLWSELAQLTAEADDVLSQPPAERAARLISFDQRQQRALRLIADMQEDVLAEEADLLQSYDDMLARQTRGETVLVAALLAALIGMLWYTRQLQRTDQTLREERQRAAQERRERLAAIGELCTGVAHGIRNPLASIHSSAELIVDLGRMDDDSRRRAQDILSECRRLSSRVTRLLNFARASERPRMRLDVGPVIRTAIAELQSEFDRRGVGVAVEGCDGALPVCADTDEMATLWIELLSNAMEHSPSGAAVCVVARREAERIVVDVHDAGPGIPPEHVGRIFELFYTTRPEGTGIGLAWARRVAESLGGRIELVTDGLTGTTFRVTLPVAT